MAEHPTQHDARLVRDLCRWFAKASRDLPWREVGADGRRNAYRSLVSEIMLQQTQVSRVLEKFEPFLERFPTLESLADAEEDEVLAMWSGLGYYRRARSLHACAREAVSRFGGLPEHAADLETLTGLGRYTAGAIASIVHNEAVPIVDGNVERVLVRIGGQPMRVGETKTRNWCWERAEELVRRAHTSRAGGVTPAIFNEALMELGAIVCTPKSPGCDSCPVRGLCEANRHGAQDSIPLPKARSAKKPLYIASLLVRLSDGMVLMEQRPKGGLWGGLWQVPTLESDRPISKASAARHFGVATTTLFGHTAFTHETTHRSVRVGVYGSSQVPNENENRHWVGPTECDGLALGSLQRRVLGSVGTGGSRSMKPKGPSMVARSADRTGFTLIELLVVIAIIALLIGILLPALGKAREAGQRTVCLSHQRDVGMALNLYANEWDEFVPRESGQSPVGPNGGEQPAWAFAFRPYLDDRATWDEPKGGMVGIKDEELDNDSRGDRFSDAPYYTCPSRRILDGHRIHYVDNGFSFMRPTSSGDDPVISRNAKPATRMSKTPYPSNTLYLTDFADDPEQIQTRRWYSRRNFTLDVAIFYDASELSHIVDTGATTGDTRFRIDPTRHGDGANAMFLDGHAGGVKPDQLTDPNFWDDHDYERPSP